LTAYTITYLGPVVDYLAHAFLVKPSLSDVTNFFGTFWNQGYQVGLVIQTYDVAVDVVLAFALAASYGLYRVLDETIVDILPI